MIFAGAMFGGRVVQRRTFEENGCVVCEGLFTHHSPRLIAYVCLCWREDSEKETERDRERERGRELFSNHTKTPQYSMIFKTA